VELWDLEIFEENLAHSFSVLDWVSWGFSEHSSMVFWLDSEFVKVAVMPYFLHIFPVGNNTIFDWVMKSTYTSFSNSVFTNVFFSLLVWTNLFIFWYSYDGWEC
jgi:hypothetical protein